MIDASVRQDLPRLTRWVTSLCESHRGATAGQPRYVPCLPAASERLVVPFIYLCPGSGGGGGVGFQHGNQCSRGYLKGLERLMMSFKALPP